MSWHGAVGLSLTSHVYTKLPHKELYRMYPTMFIDLKHTIQATGLSRSSDSDVFRSVEVPSLPM